MRSGRSPTSPSSSDPAPRGRAPSTTAASPPTVGTILGSSLAGGLLDHYLGRTGYSSQQTDEPADPAVPDCLSSPVPGDHGTHGPFDDRSHARSLQLPLSLHRRSLAAGLGLVGAAAALALRR